MNTQRIRLPNMAICPLTRNMIVLDVDTTFNYEAKDILLTGSESLCWISVTSVSPLKGKRTHMGFVIGLISFHLRVFP